MLVKNPTKLPLMIYDRAQNHFKGAFPKKLPIEQAYIHIGMFLGWILENGLYSDFFEEEEGHQIMRFRSRQITCAILCALWDGDLTEDLLNNEGNAFSAHYYQSGLYQQDYKQLLASRLPSMYHVEDTWENFEKISARISERFQSWRAGV